MPLHVKDFVIQAQFEDEGQKNEPKKTTETDVASLKEDIISDCMEILEEYLRKREGR